MRITASAEADVEAIWTFTEQRWGTDMADRYVATIRGEFARAGAEPAAGLRTEEAASWRYRRAGRHRIFYLYDADEVTVVRILHMQMDVARHLP